MLPMLRCCDADAADGCKRHKNGGLRAPPDGPSLASLTPDSFRLIVTLSSHSLCPGLDTAPHSLMTCDLSQRLALSRTGYCTPFEGDRRPHVGKEKCVLLILNFPDLRYFSRSHYQRLCLLRSIHCKCQSQKKCASGGAGCISVPMILKFGS